MSRQGMTPLFIEGDFAHQSTSMFVHQNVVDIHISEINNVKGDIFIYLLPTVNIDIFPMDFPFRRLQGY
jgi:hypothetical protein